MARNQKGNIALVLVVLLFVTSTSMVLYQLNAMEKNDIKEMKEFIEDDLLINSVSHQILYQVHNALEYSYYLHPNGDILSKSQLAQMPTDLDRFIQTYYAEVTGEAPTLHTFSFMEEGKSPNDLCSDSANCTMSLTFLIGTDSPRREWYVTYENIRWRQVQGDLFENDDGTMTISERYSMSLKNARIKISERN